MLVFSKINMNTQSGRHDPLTRHDSFISLYPVRREDNFRKTFFSMFADDFQPNGSGGLFNVN